MDPVWWFVGRVWVKSSLLRYVKREVWKDKDYCKMICRIDAHYNCACHHVMGDLASLPICVLTSRKAHTGVARSNSSERRACIPPAMPFPAQRGQVREISLEEQTANSRDEWLGGGVATAAATRMEL